MINSRLNLYFSFIFSLSATFGSLYFSEILRYPPCVLCWYQRICMYPLVLIFGAAIWTEDSQFLKYTLPLSFLGLGIA
ncbi:MAG: disulfide bond formation protein B, partial [Pseudobdellovibrionaceae bacterium]